MGTAPTNLRITRRADCDALYDSVGFMSMRAVLEKFRDVARWTVVNTTVSGRGHPEPPRRHRRGTRLAYLHIRVMIGELVRWRRQASRYGLSLSEFVRLTMNKGRVRVVAVADPEHLSELKRQGNNLNQLLHAIHGNFPMEPARVEAVLLALHTLYRREIERG